MNYYVSKILYRLNASIRKLFQMKVPLDDVEVVSVISLPDDEVSGRHLPFEHRVQDFAQLQKALIFIKVCRYRRQHCLMGDVFNLQCDQIGRFLEFLGNKFYYKVAQMLVDFLGICEKHCFFSQTGQATF